MDKATVAVSAAVSAVVAVAAAKVVNHLKEKKEGPREIETIPEALQHAYNRGWNQGREALMQDWTRDAHVTDFTQK